MHWQLGMDALNKYKNRVGDCNIHFEHNEDGFELGRWVGNVRSRKDKLDDVRINELTKIGFIWTVNLQVPTE